MLCGTFWKGVPSGTKGAPSIDLIWVPLSDVLLQDSKCGLTLSLDSGEATPQRLCPHRSTQASPALIPSAHDCRCSHVCCCFVPGRPS